MGKIFLQSIGPTGWENRISLSPHDRGRLSDRGQLTLRIGEGHLSRPTPRSIPGNTSPDSSRLRIAIHNRFKLFGTKRLLVANPMLIEIRQIETYRFPIMTDELIGLRKRVEMLVPALLLGSWLQRAGAKTGIHRRC